MTIYAINHVQITIPMGAEDHARAFYCDLLGLTELEKPKTLKENGGFWLEVGVIQLHIGTEDDIDRHKTKAHVALEVDDLEQLRKLLQSKQVRIIENVQIKGFKRFDIRDPFGNRIEFMERV